LDIDDWLRGIGLEQYAQTFRDNAIDADVLCDLTDEHLRELGLPLGARLKLLRAVAALTTGQTPVSPEITTPAARTDAERRQVTVMFSDMVGSTALSARMDPEDLREVISAYQKCVAETVGRFGGFVAKYMGDGVLIYFGYPQAHEDDAERAVRAGLELVSAVGAVKTHSPLQTRVGIATGLVIVGDLIGSGASQEQAIVGETPNLAARLQGLAEPNMVVIAENTRKLIGNLFELEDLGAQKLKGIAELVRASAALRPSSIESRFEALHAAGLTELVGREEELDLLLRRWSKARTGEGQVVLLSGEAGIGKSRLTAALLEGLAVEPHTRLRYFCSPQHTDSALYPIVSQMERAAGFTHNDNTQAKLDKLDALLARSFTPRQDAALLADMVSLPNDGRHLTLELAPQQRRQKMLEALTVQLEALSRSNPVLMIFEDVHWVDPTTLEALGRTVDRLRTLSVLLIVTHRPEFEPPWIGRSYVTTLSLNRLGEREIVAMIDRVTGNKALPESIRQDIIERTDGIPLFVEEMTRAVLEAEGLGDARTTTAAVPSARLAVPATLHASLMARLDRLGSAKEVAQIGAAIGREFSHTLLAAVVGRQDAALQSALDRLVAAGLLFRQGVLLQASYLFKHALVQDAAYGTLLREPRRSLHARIAATLESEFPEVAESQPELLARHYSEAGIIEKSASLWGKAGRRSLDRSAFVEAVEQLNRALQQFGVLPTSSQIRRDQISLQVVLINALMQVKGYAAPETKAAVEHTRSLIEQAEALGEPAEDPLLLFSVLYGMWVANSVAFNGDAIRELAAQVLALAEKHGTTVPLMVGYRLKGATAMWTGNFAEGRTYLGKAFALYDPNKHRLLATRFGQDVRAAILFWRSPGLWMFGYPDAALTDVDQAIKDGREITHAGTLLFALAATALTHILCGNYGAANAQSEEAIALADAKGLSAWKGWALMNEGSVSALTHKPADALETLRAGIAVWRSTGGTILLPIYLSNLAMAYAELGNAPDAWRLIAEAQKAVETTKETWSEAEVSRIAGLVALSEGVREARKAEAYFQHALAVARQQQAKSWELRAAMSLARLWRNQGDAQQAHELLAPVYGWFTEGFDTRDLKEAKTLLEELHA
jgi:class 3 adenylate cyclase/predicted ATPase